MMMIMNWKGYEPKQAGNVEVVIQKLPEGAQENYSRIVHLWDII
jgi:hypothetical protein